MGQQLQPWTPSTALSLEQMAIQSKAVIAHATSPQDALRAAKRLAGSWPHARPPDPEGWAASLAAVLAQYPLGLVEQCVDPRVGLARGREFPPTVASVVEWCDRELKKHMTLAEYRPRALPPPEKVFTPEHEHNMRQRLSRLMHNLFDPKPGPGPSDDELRAHYQHQPEAAE